MEMKISRLKEEIYNVGKRWSNYKIASSNSSCINSEKKSCRPTTLDVWERSQPLTLVRMKMISTEMIEGGRTYPCCTGWGRDRSPVWWPFLYPPKGESLSSWQRIRLGRISIWNRAQMRLPTNKIKIQK